MCFRALLFIIVICFSANLQSIELRRVILATNNNPDYIEFWPVVAPLWREMGLIPTLAFIGEDDVYLDESLGEVIRFHPIKGVPESLQAQTVRLLLPTLFPEDGCIISDIDMLPILKSYFFDGALKCPEEAFLVYRDKAYPPHELKFPMCYFAANGSVFRSVFQVFEKSEIEEKIKEWNDLHFYWNTDEIMLFDSLIKWEKQGGRIVRLGGGVGPRLDRGHWDVAHSILKIEYFIDCHAPRPYSINKESIDLVVTAILDFWRREKSI